MTIKDYFVENKRVSLTEEQLQEIRESNNQHIEKLKEFFMSKTYESLDEDKYVSLEKNFNKMFTEVKSYNSIVNLTSNIRLTNEYLLNKETLLPESQKLAKRFGSLYENALSNFLCIMEASEDKSNEAEIITEDAKVYDELIQKLQEAKENNVPIDEGILGSIIGGLTGATFGPMIGRAFCKALNVDERGTLGNLLTSRLVCTAVAAYVGYKN
jgi:hypothetical protein